MGKHTEPEKIVRLLRAAEAELAGVTCSPNPGPGGMRVSDP
jgi:hypothetical protein